MRSASVVLAALACLGFADGAVAAPGPMLAQLPGASGCISQDPKEVQCTQMRANAFSPTLALSPDGRNVYATSMSNSSGVVVNFRRDPVTGALTEGGCVGGAECQKEFGISGAQASAVSSDGRNVYTVSDGFAGSGGALVSFDRDRVTGDLTPRGCVGRETGCSGRDFALEGASAVAVSPDGRHVYVAAKGRLLTFERNTESGGVERVDCIGSEEFCRPDADLATACAGATGRCQVYGPHIAHQLVLSPDGRHLYAANDRRQPAVFTRDPVSGALAPAPCGPAGAACDSAPYATGGVSISPDGRHVYTSSWPERLGPVGDDWRFSLISLRRDITGGGLSPFGCLAQADRSKCRLAREFGSPAGVAVSADGGAVYAAIGGAGTPDPDGGVAVLRRDRVTGRLSESGCVTQTGTGGRCVQGSGLLSGRAVLVSPDGRSVYVSGYNSNIAVLGPAVALEGTALRFSRRGAARARLRCPRIARARCRGTLVIRRAGRAASSSAPRMAVRRFSIRPGRRPVLKVRLSRAGRRVLRRGKRIRGQVAIRTSGRLSGRPTRRVTLRRR